MNTFIKEGRRLGFTNSSGSAITAGAVVVLTSGNSGFIGIAVTDVANGADGVVEVREVHRLTALSTDTGAIGAVMYWDATNSRLTTTSTSNTRAGRLAKAKVNGDTTADILVNQA